MKTLATFVHQPWCTSNHEDSPEPEVEPCRSDAVFAGAAWAFLRHTDSGTRLVLNPEESLTLAQWAELRDGVDQLVGGA